MVLCPLDRDNIPLRSGIGPTDLLGSVGEAADVAICELDVQLCASRAGLAAIGEREAGSGDIMPHSAE